MTLTFPAGVFIVGVDVVSRGVDVDVGGGGGGSGKRRTRKEVCVGGGS